MAEQGQDLLDGDKNESWMNSKWRPMMGWMYMLVCTMDFVIFPILWSLLQAMNHGRVETQWNPITLQGAGLFHMAMGAIIGVAAFGRTQEKLAGVSNSTSSSGFAAPAATSGSGTASSTTNIYQQGSANIATPTPAWTGNTTAVGTNPLAGYTVTASGKTIVPPAPQPEI